MELTFRVDTTNLMKAQKILMRHSNTAPARSINKTALFTIRKAQDLTWVVSQGTINTDLEVKVTPRLAIAGKRKGKPLKSGAVDIEVPDWSVGMMIVMARMNPNSKYSLLTGNRWPVNRIRIRDFAKAYGPENALRMFFDTIAPIAERMVRARHSSTGFLKHSWAAIIMKLLKVTNDGKGAPDWGAHAVLMSGDVEPAKPGYPMAVCVVSNTLGMKNDNVVLGEKYNKAAHDFLEPILQVAINQEFWGKLEYANKQEWAKLEPELRLLGIQVQPSGF